MRMIRKFKRIVKTNRRCNAQISSRIRKKPTIVIRNKWREFIIMGINVHIIEGNIRKNYGHHMDINRHGNITFYIDKYYKIAFFKCKNDEIIYHYDNYGVISMFNYYVKRCLSCTMRLGNSTFYLVRKHCVCNNETADFYRHTYNQHGEIESMENE